MFDHLADELDLLAVATLVVVRVRIFNELVAARIEFNAIKQFYFFRLAIYALKHDEQSTLSYEIKSNDLLDLRDV